jgi:predicted porin
VSVVNGNGYKNPGRSKGVDVEGRLGFVPFENMVVAIGGYRGHRGQETENVNAVNTAERGDIMVAYASDAFRLGAEYFTAKNWNNVLTTATDKADGYSLWGSVAVADDVSLFARYDNAKLSKTLDGANKNVYYNAGVEYQVTKGFKLAGVWKHEKADKSVSTPVPPHVRNVKTNEIGVFGEVRF